MTFTAELGLDTSRGMAVLFELLKSLGLGLIKTAVGRDGKRVVFRMIMHAKAYNNDSCLYLRPSPLHHTKVAEDLERTTSLGGHMQLSLSLSRRVIRLPAGEDSPALLGMAALAGRYGKAQGPSQLVEVLHGKEVACMELERVKDKARDGVGPISDQGWYEGCKVSCLRREGRADWCRDITDVKQGGGGAFVLGRWLIDLRKQRHCWVAEDCGCLYTRS